MLRSLLTFICVTGIRGYNSENILDWCLDGENHKVEPGPEAQLYSQCTPWKDRSCCTYNTSERAHLTGLYNFNYDHCSSKRNMSEKCREHFIQDLCFYECSPNIGPWVVKVSMKTRKERFVDVPLCQSDCDVWFNSCINDYTCSDNWVRNWKWINGVNTCFPESECRTFKEVFKTAANFCQRVWDYSWKATSDDLPCMRMWFNGSSGNPNDAVAQLYAQHHKCTGTLEAHSPCYLLALFLVVGIHFLR